MTTITVSDCIATLKSRTPLDAATPQADVEAALATMIRAAGAALSPSRKSAVAILDNLLILDKLTQARTDLIPFWLGLRALNLSSGNIVAVSKATLDNPIFDALAQTAGVIPSLDTTDIAHGAFLVNRATSGRTVISKANGLVVSNATETLTTLPYALDPKGSLAILDALNVVTGVKRPVAVSYAAKDTKSPTFTASVFAPYTVQRITINDAIAHPTDLVESAALASVTPPMPSYKPKFHPAVLKNGLLSDVQLETIIYAGEAHSRMLGAHPNNPAFPAPRQGFLVGHGTGVGKGRIIAGVIADNWTAGKRRHVWFSESANLIDAAREDWEALGGNKNDIVDIRDMASGAPINLSSGILFATYAALRTTHNGASRMEQIAAWLGQEDGVVAFDESQNLRNSITHTGETGWQVDASAQGIAATKLQDKLPNARVLYVSATSASDILSMSYAVRLGLWGEGTAFARADDFFAAMSEGGTNALEMVARDLKAMGLYLAANVSFDGVTYEQIEHQMTDEERRVHDVLSEMWLEIADGLKLASHTTGIKTGPKTSIGRSNRKGDVNFNMARARFFQATIAAMKTPMVIEHIRTDLQNGHAVVVQLSNTFEANMDKAIQAAIDAGQPLSSVEGTPRDIMLTYLDRDFPVYIYQQVKTARGTQVQPLLDANGDHVVCPRAKAERDKLVAKVMALPIPEGPLEQLFAAFDGQIAEATGRKRRLVTDVTGKKFLQDIGPDAIKADVAAFMNDQKRILVFSDAGATGATYSAALTRANQRLRRHYVLQPGWRADKAIQGMGRTHRSNQKQPPQYILPTIDLWADQRMTSRVARGMRDLGALTRGLRQAASQDFFTQDNNLEDEFGQNAWVQFVQKLANNEIHGLSLAEFSHQANIALHYDTSKPVTNSNLPRVQRFLNAMSAMTYKNQTIFGRAYRSELDALRVEAMKNGTFDRGIETIQPDNLIKLEDAVIYRDPRTGGETRLLKMLRIDTIDPMDFDTARKEAIRRGNASVARSLTTGRIAVLSFPRGLREQMPSSTDIVRVYTPGGMRERTRADVVAERWQRVEARMAQNIWDAEMNDFGTEEEKTFWVVTGAMLPIWDKLPRGRSLVYRMETDEAEQIIGRIVSEDFVSNLLKTVDALTSGGLPHADVMETLTKGGIITLANGWNIVGRHSRVHDTHTVRLVMPEQDAASFVQRKASTSMRQLMAWSQAEAHFDLGTPNDWDRAVADLLAISVAVTAATV